MINGLSCDMRARALLPTDQRKKIHKCELFNREVCRECYFPPIALLARSISIAARNRTLAPARTNVVQHLKIHKTRAGWLDDGLVCLLSWPDRKSLVHPPRIGKDDNKQTLRMQASTVHSLSTLDKT